MYYKEYVIDSYWLGLFFEQYKIAFLELLLTNKAQKKKKDLVNSISLNTQAQCSYGLPQPRGIKT